jgi:AraC-like DNA-binding protein
LWVTYSNTLVGQLTTVRLEKTNNQSWALVIDDRRPVGFPFNFSVEELLMMAIRVGTQVVRREIVPYLVELSYPEPKHHERYAELISCPLRYNAPLTRIKFEGFNLSETLRGYDEDFHSLCVRHCASVMRQISVQSPYVTRIRNHLLSSKRPLPSLEELATELGMSSRTLRRRLRIEGCTYQQLLTEVRLDLAKEYLRLSLHTAKETAYLLGFEDTNAFRRAFRSWTGQTIRSYREQVSS